MPPRRPRRWRRREANPAFEAFRVFGLDGSCGRACCARPVGGAFHPVLRQARLQRGQGATRARRKNSARPPEAGPRPVPSGLGHAPRSLRRHEAPAEIRDEAVQGPAKEYSRRLPAARRRPEARSQARLTPAGAKRIRLRGASGALSSRVSPSHDFQSCRFSLALAASLSWGCSRRTPRPPAAPAK